MDLPLRLCAGYGMCGAIHVRGKPRTYGGHAL